MPGSRDSEQFMSLYRKLQCEKQFDIPLRCPTCNGSLKKTCPECDVREGLALLGMAATATAQVWAFLQAAGAAIFCAYVGIMFGGERGGKVGSVIGLSIGAIVWRDLNKGMVTTEEPQLLRLARWYQYNAATFDQAAYCYLQVLNRGAMVDSFPESFRSFLRDYHSAEGVNEELRESLCNGVIATVCGLRSGRWESQDVWEACDRAYLGTEDQKEILMQLEEYVAGERYVGASQCFDNLRKITSGHSQGVDLGGVDLRFPLAATFFRRVLAGAPVSTAIGKASLSDVTSSDPYCRLLANELSELPSAQALQAEESLRKEAPELWSELARKVGVV